MTKKNASENARFVANPVLRIHGGCGYLKDYPPERMYRDAKITEIYEKTRKSAGCSSQEPFSAEPGYPCIRQKA